MQSRTASQKTTLPFQTLSALRAACLSLPESDHNISTAIAKREAKLTKPLGSLGRLEELVSWLGQWQKKSSPQLKHVQITIFAGNHGVTKHGVSPWPSNVTAQMVENFKSKGAAINQLAAHAQANLDVISLNNLKPTADFTTQPAMTETEFLDAVSIGFQSVSPNLDLFCPGEMGIGNTTPAAALSYAFFGGKIHHWVGAGTGINKAGIKRKSDVISQALQHHHHTLNDPLLVAQSLGGFELAAIMGAVLAARHHNIPVLLDGFICTAAVLPLLKLNSKALDHTRLSHCSAEKGHQRLAKEMALNPLLHLGLRLGEGSGAALAIPLLRAALACHTQMATFEEASISQKTSS
ncbi:nicotinate-nucleotide--dimethylbenzimidazole phosphoribosyltransferase [Swingsia samuiensis]|uniref:Nicotinate-nucleotide--dimethylbenzimidazole phosphoribosyltransferase n=1 Tax=Swingsia samuiensis TaxID=1293412 RepID=A0A4Y6UMX6_9PROT|nr:nicotinate-nucleotide--dimethylbenzimidazole phosphoribosyltransferase [Swingsia samuiensis]QDH17746.1 nicotinate-nucleotide--dimethylbenzimidazole phosphoribosyltransferase [Swingsia samuiensis]